MLTTLLFTAALAQVGSASYLLTNSWTASNFFSQFSFFTSTDPTSGYVTFVDQGTASSNGLINTNNNQIYIGVDHTNVASGSGRDAVRITSTASFNHGLFILDLAHMPASICGVWPAFWMLGPNWPYTGEIDIIEGVNVNTNNAMTLHTSDGCTVVNDGAFTGTLTTSNCYAYASGQSSNAGCDIQDTRSNSYGSGFNAIGGGVFATQWESDSINVWFFPRGSIPSDITNGAPDTTQWGAPAAQFYDYNGSCDIDAHFSNLQIVFDTTFCGDWAGSVWSSTATCSSLASSCQAYVQNNPSAFTDAYWLINSLKTYAQPTGGPIQQAGPKNVTSVSGAVGEGHGPIKSTPLAMGAGLDGVTARKRGVWRKWWA